MDTDQRVHAKAACFELQFALLDLIKCGCMDVSMSHTPHSLWSVNVGLLKHPLWLSDKMIKIIPIARNGWPDLFRCLVFVVIGLGLAGCVPSRAMQDPNGILLASIPDNPEARNWGDAPAAQLLSFVEGRAVTKGASCPADTPKMLALSGGAEGGAFGAGYLRGWTESGQRPQFDTVTGVSTGALIAPLAFLGTGYDAILEDSYLGIHKSDIYRGRLFPFSLLSDGLVSTAPLKARIERIVTPDMVRQFAAEHAKGRRLFVSTTNLDAQRPVIWDIGAIASGPHPQDAEYLIEQVILASASIPGIFPPVMIETTLPSGETVSEMHVDGAATGNILAAPIGLIDLPGSYRCRNPLQLYAIVNGRLSPEFSTVPTDAISIAERGVETSMKYFSNHALATARVLDQRGVIDLEVIAIDDGFSERRPDKPFDAGYMERLFSYGKKRALQSKALTLTAFVQKPN